MRFTRQVYIKFKVFYNTQYSSRSDFKRKNEKCNFNTFPGEDFFENAKNRIFLLYGGV